MNTLLKNVLGYAEEHNDAFLADFFEFLKIASISTDTSHKHEISKAAEWLMQYLKNLGVPRVEIFETKGNPLVFGEWLDAGGDKPTILVYGHYDVQPPDPLSEWETDPFSPDIRNNHIYARGASDMKGQLMITLSAIKSFTSVDKLPVNLKFIFEGEEEIGSPTIQNFLSEKKDLLRADFALNLDAGMISEDMPTIVYGLRGLAYFELIINGPSHDLHSGLFGGLVYNPAQALCELLSKMKTADGKITLPGFYDSVVMVDEQERAELARLPLNDGYYEKQSGVNQLYGESGFTAVERVGARPTLEIHGILSGYTGEGPKTVIPSQAMAKISMRLVPNQTPSEVHSQLKAFIENNCPKEVSWELRMLSSDPACVIERDFWATACFAQSLEEIWGTKPVYKREGGSIPIVSHMRDILGVPSVLSGFGLPEDRIHSPNENINLIMWNSGIKTVVNFLARVSEHCRKNDHEK